jgi:hypothetical protein
LQKVLAPVDEVVEGGYYIIPPIQKIAYKASVSNFVISRKGFGSISFKSPVDLTGITSLSILRNIIEIELGRVAVYPDESKHPPAGTGLNMPAEVIMENLWPSPCVELGKFTDDLRSKPETVFTSYNSDSGTYVFNVQHFSAIVAGGKVDQHTRRLRSQSSSLHLDPFTASTSHGSEAEPEPPPLVKACAAKRAKQRLADAKKLFYKLIRQYLQRKMPSDVDIQTLNTFMDVIDVEHYLTWRDALGDTRGLEYDGNNAIIFNDFPLPPHDRLAQYFWGDFSAKVNAQWPYPNPFEGAGSESKFALKLY